VSNVLAEPWFWPAVIVVVGLPLLLILFTEIASALDRAGSPAAKIVRLVRTVVLPLGALLLLLSQVDNLALQVNSTRVVATVFGFVVILVLLNTVNVALFATASRGSWRQRMPSIFVDLARLLLIVVSLAILFSWVWGADVGGLFTALGVTSIVIGLALQNAAGSVVSGLLLLFEQPFQLGDWLETGGTRGRVVEVNWRAVHIDTGNGILIVPTASLAGSSFLNLSRVRGIYTATTTVTFATDDAPQDVIGLIRRVAAGLPNRPEDQKTGVIPLGGAKYEVSIPVTRPSEESDAIAVFLIWLWYAARRENLHLDNDLTDDYRTPERLDAALVFIAPTLHLSREDARALAPDISLERYGSGETMQRMGEIPTGMSFIVNGRAALTSELTDSAGKISLPFAQLGPGEVFGLAAYTRQRSGASCIAITDVAVIVVPTAIVDQLIRSNRDLAGDIGTASDSRRAQAEAAAASQLNAAPSNIQG
jgi:small-conductance mechanosensitive channel